MEDKDQFESFYDIITRKQQASHAKMVRARLALNEQYNIPVLHTCAHLRWYVRPEGTRVCLACDATCAQGQEEWYVHSVLYCLPGEHMPYPDVHDGVQQCQRCPFVWRDAA